jgi:hypothetical protein
VSSVVARRHVCPSALEHGENVILRWTDPARQPWFFLAELGDVESR